MNRPRRRSKPEAQPDGYCTGPCSFTHPKYRHRHGTRTSEGRQLPDGRWIECLHFVPGHGPRSTVGPDPHEHLPTPESKEPDGTRRDVRAV